MSNLYVRIKGRVQGPFDLETLQGMVQRGQLSRIHQVSEDGEIWKKSTEYAELFKSNSRGSSGVHVEQSPQESTTNQSPQVTQGPTAPQAPDAEWHVEENGTPAGPYSIAELRKLFRSGKFEPYNLVWREGMSDWVPADTVDGLVSAAAFVAKHSGSQTAQPKQSDAVDPQTISILNDSRGWIILCAVVLVIGAISQFVAAFTFLVQGIRQDVNILIISALGIFSSAIVNAFWAWLMFSYSSSLLKLRIDGNTSSLHFAARRLNRIWTFVGTVTLLTIILGVIAFILSVALGPDFSNY